MSGPGEDDGPAIEMRPIAPAGRLLPADKAVLRDWVLRADPREGTLVLTEDRPFIVLPPRRRLAALPASGRKDAVVTVCLASYRWRRSGFFAAYQEGISWRLLLLDRDGRAVAAGRTRDEHRARQIWPPELFAPLANAGVAVTEERFANAGELDRAHPGASPHWRLATGPASP